MKKNKGVTLVVLVLSIIILIVLSSVVINTVSETKIGEKTENVKQMNDEIIEEQTKTEEKMLTQNTTDFNVQ